MQPEVAAALVTGVFGLLVLIPGILLRRRTQSAVVIRRSLTRQEALENYVFQLRRQVFAVGRVPHPWPQALVYLNRDDQDRPVDDEQP